MTDKAHALSRVQNKRPLMHPGMHSVLLISRLVSISSRKPLSFSRSRRRRDLVVYFVPSPSTRRPSSYFLDRHRAALSPRPSSLGLRFPKLPSAAFSVFLSSPSALPGFLLSIAPVIRLRLRRRLFSSTAISLDPPPRRFFSFLAPGLGP